MADNWSTFATLASKGDYLAWSVELDADDADQLNYVVSDISFAYAQVAVRAARQGADDVARVGVIINDFVIAGDGGPVDQNQGGDWNDAGRFWINQFNVPPNGPDFSAASLTNTPSGVFGLGRPLTGILPWAAGANVVKVMNFGPDAVDIDFVSLQTVVASSLSSLEDTAETKPSDYDAHTNGTTRTGLGPTRWWFLKAPDGSAGTAADATLDVTKLCPHGADEVRIGVHVHDGGTPLSGEVGSYGSAIDAYAAAALDGDGRALVTAPSSDPPIPNVVWFGGNDDYGPETGGGDAFHGCGGWHVGNVGMG